MKSSSSVKNINIGAVPKTIVDHIIDNSLILLPLIIEKESNKTILITTKNVTIDENNHALKHLVIKISDNETDCITIKIITIAHDRYHHIHFINLNRCRVYIISKLVKAYFYDCIHSQVSIRKSMIGGLEFFCCEHIKVSIKIPEDSCENPIPMTRIEACQNFRIYQQLVQGLLYLVKMSVDIRCIIIRSENDFVLKDCNMGKIIWDPHEQIFVYMSISQSEGTILSSQYVLNDISHNFIQDEEGHSHLNTIFGSTPPLYDSEIIKILK